MRGFFTKLLMAGVVSASLSVYAQEITAGIYGTVQDSTGSLIPGATITMRNTETARTHQAASDGSGNFVFTLIPFGMYEVTAEAKGFKKQTVTNVLLRVNDNRKITFTLDVGQITEQVTVEATTVAVNTASGATSAVLDGQDLVKMPSRGRFVMPFALLMPGAVSTTPNNRRNNNTAVNGVRPTHNAWLLDGGYNIDTGGNWGAPLAPNIETVAEFRAIRGNYNAEFGIGGGSQFNVVSKSGTNQIHGSLYEFLRNEKLNARNYFNPARNPFKANDFGGSVGGPVYIPKIYNGRDKTFFYAFIGRTKIRQAEQFFNRVPTQVLRNGDFNGLPVTTVITDPTTGQPFPNRIIPTTRFDKNAVAYMQMYPLPNFLDSTGRNHAITQGRAENVDEYNFRGDHHIGDKHRAMFRYTRELRTESYATAAGFEWLRRNDKTPANNMVANFNSMLSPTLINDFNWTRSHNRIMQFPPELSASRWGINIPQLFPDTDQTYPLASLNLTKVPDRVPTLTFNGGNYANINPSSPWSNYQTIYDFKDNLTWIRGTHTIKTGFDYAYEIKFEPTNTDVFGRFTFDTAGAGEPWANFLLGNAFQYDETNTVAFNDNRRNAFEAYVDDSWKVNRRLTLNFGVRYSLFNPAYEPDERFRVFRKDNYDPSKAVTVNASGQIIRGTGDRFNGLVNPKDYWQNSKKNFAPRFSFAYDLFGKGKTAVRGGYGIFYSREILGAFILMSGNPPFSELLTVFNANLSSPGGGSTRTFDLPITLGSIDTNQLTPYTQQWNLNIQQELGGNMVMEVGYSGSRAIHMMRTQDINQPLPSAVARDVNQARPFKGWGAISHREQSYMSNYHAFQTNLSRSFSRGLGTTVSYTWSKAIDNADFTGGIYGAVGNTYDSSGERGPANFDSTHNLVVSYIYELPFWRQRRDALGYAFGGWQVSGISTFQTGLPISPELGSDRARTGQTARQRPATIRSPFVAKGERTVDRWFDASAYTEPAFGTFAPTARNILRGPGVHNWDFSLNKYFQFKEKARIEVRADAFNVFNHTQFGGATPAANTTAGTGVGLSFATPAAFGRISAARNERNVMLGLRLEF